MNDPFPPADFDDWAETYDQSTQDVFNFPFTGYERTLDTILALAQPCPGMRILDLGTGTGNLALLFDAAGCECWCTDFSPKMLAVARRKLPAARFFLHDLRQPLLPELYQPFERILSAYTFHHFDLPLKVRILKDLCAQALAPGGSLLIGDIAFADAAAQERLKEQAGVAWEDEFYWLADAAIPALEQAGMSVRFQSTSPSAGVFFIQPTA